MELDYDEELLEFLERETVNKSHGGLRPEQNNEPRKDKVGPTEIIHHFKHKACTVEAARPRVHGLALCDGTENFT